jgi:hypothetical protein
LTTRVLSIDPLSVTETGSFTLMARLKEFPDQSTADSTTKTIFNIIEPFAPEVEQLLDDKLYLTFFYALGSGSQSFPLSRNKKVPESCVLQSNRIQVIPLTNTSFPFL